MAKTQQVTEIEAMVIKEVARNKASLLRAVSTFTLEIVKAQTQTLFSVFCGAKVISKATVDEIDNIFYASLHLVNEVYRGIDSPKFEEQAADGMVKARAWFNEQGGDWDKALNEIIEREKR